MTNKLTPSTQLLAASSQKNTLIQFLLVDEMLATSTTLPAEMLQSAKSAATAFNKKHELDKQAGGKEELSHLITQTVSTTLKPVKTRANISLVPDEILGSTDSPNIIFLPSLWRNPQKTIKQYPAVIDWLQCEYKNGATIAGVGTGCCFMAEAELLDNKPATTHWYYFEQFEKKYPSVNLKKDFFITQVDNLYCAASINSLADLTVHFIKLIYGNEIAHHIERNFSHEIRRDYESMRYFEGSTDQHSDETILQTQVWLQDNYSSDIQFSTLAGHFDLSVRSFNRRFKLATGKTPLKYLQEIRIGIARDLLQTTNLSISEIAYRVGYHDLGHFSSLFKKTFNATPHDYRTTVRAKLFSLDAMNTE
ncbi:MAG: helix-turn-helix domain-containing protein [Cellvibrionaceae bacterium]